MKKILNFLALIALLFSATSFASCEKGLPIQPVAQDIQSMDLCADGLHALINNYYRVSLDVPFTAQVVAMSAENASSIPVNITINGILFTTSAEAGIYPDDMAHLRWGLEQGRIVKVKIEFFASGMTVAVKISSLIQY